MRRAWAVCLLCLLCLCPQAALPHPSPEAAHYREMTGEMVWLRVLRTRGMGREGGARGRGGGGDSWSGSCGAPSAAAVACRPRAAPISSHSSALAEEGLLLTFRDGITNWAEVKAAWNLSGWCSYEEDPECHSNLTVCTWGGVE